MAVVMRCKLCGGELTLTEGSPVAVCEYCGARQTVPRLDDEKKLTLFARAGRLLRGCEFDKAAGIYETIAAEFPEEAEAYWCLVLCKYGIEYVDDPGTGKKVPTCHRSSFDSVLEDENYDLALEYADIEASRLYRQEAKQIEELRRNIIEVSGREEPYDIFICYKETAANGDRTLDSVLAQDIYDALTEKGYRVFFSRVTLEDKLGQEYEPYIFAALNSATVMLAVGTDYEYYNAVWVKNEWSRFLQLMASGKKKYLIPCFKGMDPYDMPKEFARLQSQDMGKVGAMQDLLRGVEKLLPKNQAPAAPAAQVVYQAAESPTLIRGRLQLEEGQWKEAEKSFDQVIYLEPGNPAGYLGKLMAAHQVKEKEALADLAEPMDGELAYQRVLRFGDESLRGDMERINGIILDRAAKARQELQRQREEALAYAEGRKPYLAQRRASLHPFRDCVCMSHTGGVLALDAGGKMHSWGLGKENERFISKCSNMVRIRACGRTKYGSTTGLFLLWDFRGRFATLLPPDYSKVGDPVSIWRNHPAKNWDYSNIVDIQLDHTQAVALMADGTVRMGDQGGLSLNGIPEGSGLAKRRDRVAQWQDIRAITLADEVLLGLRADGTVVSADGDDSSWWYSEALGWTEQVDLAAGKGFAAGLGKNGTVQVCFNSGYSVMGAPPWIESIRQAAASWTDIVQIAAGSHLLVGLRADGTVAAAGEGGVLDSGNISTWQDVAAVACGGDGRVAVGLRADGTLLAAGPEGYKSDLSGVRLFRDGEDLRRQLEQRRSSLAQKHIGLFENKKGREAALRALDMQLGR